MATTQSDQDRSIITRRAVKGRDQGGMHRGTSTHLIPCSCRPRPFGVQPRGDVGTRATKLESTDPVFGVCVSVPQPQRGLGGGFDSATANIGECGVDLGYTVHTVHSRSKPPHSSHSRAVSKSVYQPTQFEHHLGEKKKKNQKKQATCDRRTRVMRIQRGEVSV